MKKDENQYFNQCSHEITHKIKKKKKNYYRPTDPNFFGNVSGNSTLIFFGLIGSNVTMGVTGIEIKWKYIVLAKYELNLKTASEKYMYKKKIVVRFCACGFNFG